MLKKSWNWEILKNVDLFQLNYSSILKQLSNSKTIKMRMPFDAVILEGIQKSEATQKQGVSHVSYSHNKGWPTLGSSL